MDTNHQSPSPSADPSSYKIFPGTDGKISYQELQHRLNSIRGEDDIFSKYGISRTPVKLGETEIPYDPNFDINNRTWAIKWKAPSSLSHNGTHTFKLITADHFMGIIGREKTRKSLLGYSIIASTHTDDPELTAGFIADVPEGSDILIFDTEQDEYDIRTLRRRMVDNLGLRADTLRVRVFSLRRRSAQSAKRIIYDEVSACSPGLVWIDSLQDLLAGRAFNNGDAVDELYNYMEFLMGGFDTGRKIPLIYTQHTNRGGKDSIGALGSLLDKKCNAQFLSSIIEDDPYSNIVKTKLTRSDGAILPFKIGHHPKTKWIEYKGDYVDSPKGEDNSMWD